MTIVNDDSSIINEQSFYLIDDTRGTIYDRRMFIIQATDQYPSLRIYCQIFVAFPRPSSGSRSEFSLSKLLQISVEKTLFDIANGPYSMTNKSSQITLLLLSKLMTMPTVHE